MGFLWWFHGEFTMKLLVGNMDTLIAPNRSLLTIGHNRCTWTFQKSVSLQKSLPFSICFKTICSFKHQMEGVIDPLRLGSPPLWLATTACGNLKGLASDAKVPQSQGGMGPVFVKSVQNEEHWQHVEMCACVWTWPLYKSCFICKVLPQIHYCTRFALAQQVIPCETWSRYFTVDMDMSIDQNWNKPSGRRARPYLCSFIAMGCNGQVQ